MTADLISVITVNLDEAAGLRATAQSVAAQERPPDQWIVTELRWWRNETDTATTPGRDDGSS